MPITYKGTLKGFSGNWQSGLATLHFYGRPSIHCENAPTARALDACFGDVIAHGHTVDSSAIDGKEVIYSVDDMGILYGFTPVEDWTGPEIPDEGIEEEEVKQ